MPGDPGKPLKRYYEVFFANIQLQDHGTSQKLSLPHEFEQSTQFMTKISQSKDPIMKFHDQLVLEENYWLRVQI